MKTVKRLNIKDKPGYFFMNLTNINDFDPKLILINEFTIFENGSIMFDIAYCKENNTLHVVFNNVECIFRKSGLFSYLIFCESDKNKRILDKYVKIINEIKHQILFIIEDEDFMRFKFEIDDNQKINQKIKKLILKCV